MSGIIFGRTQSAIQTPFIPARNPSFNGDLSPFVSTDVQNAIEEALSRAIANDKFLLLTHYLGNASVGRYLEWYPSESSDVSPIYLISTTNIAELTCQTTSAAATCNIGVFDLNVSSVTPLYTIVMSAQKRVSFIGSPTLATVNAGGLLAMRVTSGAINKPEVQITLNSA